LPKKKLVITMDLQCSLDIPHPVKITYLTPCETAPALVMA
jgi:hypothetical protein